MSDDELRSRFEDALATVPVPQPSVASARGRARRARARRLVASTCIAVAVAAAAMFVVWDHAGSRTPTSPAITPPSNVDVRALRLVDDLGPLCRSYDFYFKKELEGGEYRPVQCGMQTRFGGPAADPASPSPPASPSRTWLLTRGPQVVLYSFSDSVVKGAWLDDRTNPWGGRLAAGLWVVDVPDPSRFKQVRLLLARWDPRVVAPPSDEWTIKGGHVVDPLPDDFDPRFSLARASRRLGRNDGELLAATLGSYRDEEHGVKPVEAWIFTARRCVPQYGGRNAAANCRRDETFVVVDATTGRVVARFVG